MKNPTKKSRSSTLGTSQRYDPFKSDIVTRTNVLFRHLPEYLQGEVDRQMRLEEEGDCDE